MNDEQRRILRMIADGKVSAQEGEALLESLGRSPSSAGSAAAVLPAKIPKYLRVVVDAPDAENGGKVNVRVPMNLIRAGVRLAAILPTGVHEQVNKALAENGVNIDVSQIKPENLEDLVEHLAELTVDVEGSAGERVRIFCE